MQTIIGQITETKEREAHAMDKSRVKTMFILLRNSPEYIWALIIVTFFSIGILIGNYIKSGEIF